MVSCFGPLTEDKTLQPNIGQKDINTPKGDPAKNTLGYNLYDFDIRLQQEFTTLQPILEEINFSLTIIAALGFNAYALLLTNKKINHFVKNKVISCDI